MKSYIISYDLRSPGRNYNALYDAIKSYGTWGKVTESTWAIITTQSAAQIRDYLLKHIDVNDRIFVIKSGGEAAWRNVIAENDWLKKHLPKV
ncbi:MAG: CRISPR-associated protein Cas2 [Ekhidna sp.]|uniref:CRISPR-associated protein Cas2 n=1 Tax=Ekhidna sp. TaxID=2608089 RepID=UPI0032ED5CD1